jgi:hypothetical protein
MTDASDVEAAMIREKTESLKVDVKRLQQQAQKFPEEKREICVSLVQSIAKECPFMVNDPRKVFSTYEFAVRPSPTMWTSKIIEQLNSDHYEHPRDLIAHVRLLFSNFRKFNPNQHTSEAFAARKAEIQAERVFVEALGEAPVLIHEIRNAVGSLSGQGREELKRIYCLYCDQEYVRGGSLSIRLEQAPHALRRRMLEYATSSSGKSGSAAVSRKRPLIGSEVPLARRTASSAITGAVKPLAVEPLRVADVTEEFHAMDPVPVNKQSDTFPSPEQSDFAGMDSA